MTRWMRQSRNQFKLKMKIATALHHHTIAKTGHFPYLLHRLRQNILRRDSLDQDTTGKEILNFKELSILRLLAQQSLLGDQSLLNLERVTRLPNMWQILATEKTHNISTFSTRPKLILHSSRLKLTSSSFSYSSLAIL